MTRFRCRLLAAAAMLAASLSGAAHDIPNDVRLQAFVKPAGTTLQLLVRVPLAAMADVDIPIVEPGYLDLARADASLDAAARLWIADNVELYEGDRRLAAPKRVAARVSLPSDRSFASYEAAFSHLAAPRLPNDMKLYWKQQLLDVRFDYAIDSDRSEFSIRPRLSRLGLRVVAALEFLPNGGPPRAFELDGDPGLVRLDPRWHQAALRFVELGFRHILDGTDHLLFLVCLVIPFRRLRALVVLVTSFTLAHSVTLIASSAGWAPDALWFAPLIETLIAASILFMALENIVGADLQRRWMVAFGFGLVHGFGFSFALRQTLQFAGTHLLTALLSFNVGVELGQLAVVLVLVPLLNGLFRFVVAERIGTIVVSALVAHTAWHWMSERAEQLRRFPWPAIDAAFIGGLLEVATAIAAIALAVGLVNHALRRTRWLAVEPDGSGDRGEGRG